MICPTKGIAVSCKWSLNGKIEAARIVFMITIGIHLKLNIVQDFILSPLSRKPLNSNILFLVFPSTVISPDIGNFSRNNTCASGRPNLNANAFSHRVIPEDAPAYCMHLCSTRFALFALITSLVSLDIGFCYEM